MAAVVLPTPLHPATIKTEGVLGVVVGLVVVDIFIFSPSVSL